VATAIVVGGLAAFVAGTYLAVVVGFGTATGAPGQLNLVVSIVVTSFIAVTFQPVRRRIELLANRLVYGRRATPYDALVALSRRLGESGAIADMLPDMASTLAAGSGAVRAAVWLAVGNELRRAAVWPPRADPAPPLTVTGGELPAIPDATVAVPVTDEGELLGALAITKPPGEPLTATEAGLIADVATQAGLALRNARLIDELTTSRQRIVAAQDAERRRLERNIHDGAQQRLVTLSLALRLVRTRLGSNGRLAAALDRATQDLTLGIETLRDLARGLHPTVLSDAGLGPALAGIVERSAIAVQLISVPSRRLPATVETTAYQVVASTLATATRSGASAARVSANVVAGRLVVEIDSDTAVSVDSGGPSTLVALGDRAAALGGSLAVHGREDRGTVVRLDIPCGGS
jgi:signal transduction histidine kinase